ncbi:hypothetical protein KIM372_16770 [Bombiscardovia nodaiensis]|uniref:Alkaline shock response membrane anchor protein AmaP n=1 Tax=Bombiscardovia nodaiensis TaxID=2932181 RepID=A0ABM8BA42_9BIFI|nr:hypothetical protein KIM372_16770 [Bombiscardovia nodaiensis]
MGSIFQQVGKVFLERWGTRDDQIDPQSSQATLDSDRIVRSAHEAAQSKPTPTPAVGPDSKAEDARNTPSLALQPGSALARNSEKVGETAARPAATFGHTADPTSPADASISSDQISHSALDTDSDSESTFGSSPDSTSDSPEDSVAQLNAVVAAVKRYKRMKRLSIFSCALMLVVWLVFVLMVLQIPSSIFGSTARPLASLFKGVDDIIFDPNLLTFLLTAVVLALAFAVYFLAAHIRSTVQKLGIDHAIRARASQLLAIPLVICTLVMLGSGLNTTLARARLGTLPFLPEGSMLLGSPYKTVATWKADPTAGRLQRKALDPIARQVDVDTDARGMEYYVYVRALPEKVPSIRDQLDNYARSSLKSLSQYGLPQAKVTIHIDDWEEHALLNETHGN